MSKRLVFFAFLFGMVTAVSAGEAKPETPPSVVAPPSVVTPPVVTPGTNSEKPPSIGAIVPKAAQTPTAAGTVVKGGGRDWPGIFRNLQAADAGIRDAAVTDFLRAIEEVAKQSKKPYFAKLQTDFASKDLKIHDEAAKHVALVGQIVSLNEKRFKPLLTGLASDDPKLRNEQLDYLFKTTEESLMTDHVRDLIEALGSEDKPTADKAYEDLKPFGGDAADELANALDEEKPQVKKMCAELLREMGPAAKDAVNTLVFKLKDGDDKLGRKYAAQILEGLGAEAVEAVDDLVLTLDDDDKSLRRICANILKKMGTAYKEATPELIVYLTHDDKTVRAIATDLLIGLGAEAKIGVEDLIDVIDEPVAPPAVPLANGTVPVPPNATNAANPINPADALANDIDSKIRAAKVLANIGPTAKDALRGLQKFANDKDPDLKDAVKLALDKITEGKPIETLLPPLEKPKPPAEKPKTPAEKPGEKPGENF